MAAAPEGWGPPPLLHPSVLGVRAGDAGDLALRAPGDADAVGGHDERGAGEEMARPSPSGCTTGAGSTEVESGEAGGSGATGRAEAADGGTASAAMTQATARREWRRVT